MTFKLEQSTLALLRERVPRGSMTSLVEQALLRALAHVQPKRRAKG
jgi:hypothetical protein